MRTTIVAGSALAALALASPLNGQISADVIVRSGPVRGHVAINEGYSTYHRYERRPVVVYERPVRVIVVERFRHHNHHRHWKRHGYRQVTVYHVDGRYYDRYDRQRRGVRQVVVYERGGRYYRDCDECDRYDRDRDRDRHGWDRDDRDHRRHDDYRDRDGRRR